MKLCISKNADKTLSNSVVISGAARSGTTILGKIIHSFEGIEYSFEPPLLFTLLPMIYNLPKNEWKILYETYMYEDFFINAISGRSINCNIYDDSSIYKVKSKKYINHILNISRKKIEAEKIGVKRKLSFKVPDLIPYLNKLKKYYPDITIIVVRRNIIDTLNSLLEKKWFSDNNLSKNIIWPTRKFRNINIPLWVKKGDEYRWSKMSVIDRSAYYFLIMNTAADKIDGRVDLFYEDLINDPNEIIQKLALQLGVSYGSKTQKLIDSVKKRDVKRDDNILEKISPNFRVEIKSYLNINSLK